MTKIFCFSGSGHSMAIAQALARLLACGIAEIGPDSETPSKEDTAVVVFPVYCQNIPAPVKRFLKTLRAKYIVFLASYGKISCGNVLHEAQKLVHDEIIAGACIPIGHTFLDGSFLFEEAYLLPIVERIRKPQRVHIPKSHKDLLADIFPALRSRVGVRLVKTNRCSSCGLCETLCPVGAIRNGRIRLNCIRCLRCLTNCPEKALQYQNSRILEKYLRSHYKEEYVLYL